MAEQTARLKLEGFLGLYQGGDGVLEDPRYAVEAVNVETRGGVLAAAARARRLEAELEEPIGTLARLHRRWHAEEGERDVLVAASGGRCTGCCRTGRRGRSWGIRRGRKRTGRTHGAG